MSRYRFALRPKWILSHLLVAALVLGMLWAAFWQLRRLDEKQARNAKVSARSEQPAVPVESLSKPGEFDATSALEFRAVTATGTFEVDQQVLVRSRSNDGAPGSWVLSPMKLANGEAVVINRGWIPNNGVLEAVPESFAAPTGEVTVTGLVRRTEVRGSIGPRDPKTGKLTNLARADVARIDRQVPEDLLPLYVQLQAQSPALKADLPSAVPKPELDEGPHLSYAVQWFIFTTVALVGYPLILRKRAREVEKEALAEPEATGPPDEA